MWRFDILNFTHFFLCESFCGWKILCISTVNNGYLQQSLWTKGNAAANRHLFKWNVEDAYDDLLEFSNIKSTFN